MGMINILTFPLGLGELEQGVTEKGHIGPSRGKTFYVFT